MSEIANDDNNYYYYRVQVKVQELGIHNEEQKYIFLKQQTLKQLLVL